MTIEELEKQIALLELEVRTLDNAQKALKIVANSGYGALANDNFRYFDVHIASAITITGQYVIRYTEKRLNRFLNDRLGTGSFDYVIGSDTDSLLLTLDNFVKKIDPAEKVPHRKMVDPLNTFCQKEIEPFLVEVYKELSENLNAKSQTLVMKREAISDYILYRAKKNYVTRVWDMEHVRYAEPQLKIAGLETQRSDKPSVCRAAMLDLIPEFFDGTESSLQSKVSKFKKEYMTFPVEDIAIPKGVNNIHKYLDSTGNVLRGVDRVPGHVMASGRYNVLLHQCPEIHDRYEFIKDRDKIKYVALREPNPAKYHTIAFKGTLPTEFGLDKYIDRDEQFNKTFIGPVESLAKLVGWKVEKQMNALDDLFE